MTQRQHDQHFQLLHEELSSTAMLNSGMIHTTKYDTTSTRSNIPVTHEFSNEFSRTGHKIVIPNVSVSEFSSTPTYISAVTHEETSNFHQRGPHISIAHGSKYTEIGKFSPTRPKLQMQYEETSELISATKNFDYT
jgi:hypothetical protein